MNNRYININYEIEIHLFLSDYSIHILVTWNIGVYHEDQQNQGHHPVYDNHIFVMVIDRDLENG